MNLEQLVPTPGSRTKPYRKGRGIGSGNGKTAGKGHKGQNARSGGGVRPGFEGGQMPLYRRLPKRGFKNVWAMNYSEINVSTLNKFEDGAEVTPELLKASGLIKKQRDLEASEMVLQVMKMQEYLDKEGKGERVSHIVIMGSGEPFDNYENVMRFIHIVNEQKGLAIGARHITVSTSGIAPKIIEYSKEGIQVNLAISLHASNDETRNKIMPINKAYPLSKLFAAIKEYCLNADRRVTIEYILLKGINDSLKNADELVELLKGVFAYVNLIPYNEVSENEFKRSEKTSVRAFYERLKNKGVNVTIRKEFGSDIDAACGQLRAKKEGVISD